MKIITKSSPFEEHKILNSIPRFLLEMNEKFEFYIAGGMITSVFTSSEINDIDIYLNKQEDLVPFIEELLEDCVILSATNKSLFVRYRTNTGELYLINLIYFDFFEKAEDIFKCFDFTSVMGAYDIRRENFVMHEDFITHNAQRRLKFNPNTNFPIMSLFRVKKYVDRGYFISKNEYLRMVLKCMTLSITAYDELEDHVGGMYGLDLDTMIDTSVEFNLPNVIEQIGEVIQDFDESLNTHKYDHDHYMRTVDEVILVHTLRSNKEKITKLKLDEDKYIFLEDGVYKYSANFTNKYFNEIPDYEDDKIRGYHLVELVKDGSLLLSESSYNYKKRSITLFYENNLEEITFYDEKTTLENKSNHNSRITELKGEFVIIVGNISLDYIKTSSEFNRNWGIKVINPKYKTGTPIEVTTPESQKIMSSDERKALTEKYNERVYNLSSLYRLDKKKALIKEQKEKQEEKEIDNFLNSTLKKPVKDALPF